MTIKYIDYNEKYKEKLCYMIEQLYIEDPEGEPMDDDKMISTIKFAEENPNSLKIYMIMDEGDLEPDTAKPVGYAIIQLIWSNEFRGITANIDEMYVMESARGRGVASKFIQAISELIPDTKRITLEVTPSNDKALELYEKQGFRLAENRAMEKIL